MKNIKLIIEYNGKNYRGWQKQPTENSVQEVIEEGIKKITQKEVKLNGSGRTDSGVHALGQVATFYTDANIEGYKFKNALNSILPSDIVIKESEEIDISFHARYHAKAKTYKYIIYNNNTRSAIHRDFSYHVPYELDIDKLTISANRLIGTYDFTSFTSKKNSKKNKVRTIHDIDIVIKGKLIEIRYTGNGFLYNMVRIMTGTLVDIARGKIKEDILDIIKAKDRDRAGITAAAQGLYLEKVYYKDNWKNI
ncbi:tRNA pseudouridine(38-40) synthase TruA [Clostridium sp. D2Q-11]|uniref:tRNA pseudouridine synthase A n=1 Tax=Anaeromonas frigoriresistens TaxID=2683708 RepID=A0A942Z689_9FIRM|nr:tRNA pseudouridine(38-40) synthase TruA [Anaeromonas frigoriresistens]MBS4537322.1 tRNA pseudouridine(38-40) synthase TruA [Anaeromonas frigoriresistens]